MANHTYLGFDFGTQRIGLAVGESFTHTAKPLAIVENRNGNTDWVSLAAHTKEWRPAGLVVGLPLDQNQQEQKITEQVRTFARALAKQSRLPVHFVNEQYTSQTARCHPLAKSRTAFEKIDDIAAVLILEEFLRKCG